MYGVKRVSTIKMSSDKLEFEIDVSNIENLGINTEKEDLLILTFLIPG
jgi:hypothetical protein